MSQLDHHDTVFGELPAAWFRGRRIMTLGGVADPIHNPMKQELHEPSARKSMRP